MGLCRTMVVMATTTVLITTARTRVEVRLMEIPTIMATTIPTISRISLVRATTTTGKVEGTGITTTTITALMIAAPVSLGLVVPAAC